MFLATLDLRIALFVLLLLPIVGSLLTVVVMQFRQRQRQSGQRTELLASLFNQAPFGLLQFDKNHHLIDFNDNAQRLLGLQADAIELPTEPWSALMTSDLAENGRYRTVVVTPDSGQRIDERTVDADERSQVIRWWIRTQPEGAIVLLFDLTNEQQAEQTANRLLSDLSHELRTPMATLLTHLEVLSLPELTPEVQQQSLGFMKDETQRLLRLSNRTLELGRLQSGATLEPQPVSLMPLAESVVSQIQVEAAAAGSHVELEADDGLLPVWGDPDQLRQVLLNLLDNAVKYGGENNRIVLALRRWPQGIVCSVRDTGPGIPVEHLSNLERRYYRASPQAVPGSGLGLSMVREILRRHNSTLQIVSQVDGPTSGTEMSFVLNAADEDRV